LKKEFIEMCLNEEEYNLLSDELKINFLNVIKSNSYEEYKTKTKIYKLENKIKLEKEINSKLLKENKKLKNKLKKEQKKNKKLISSKSWKITKPLRKIRNFYK